MVNIFPIFTPAMPGLVACLIVGFVAQLIDGALGMAYGVSCTTFLLTFGASPAVASASVKTAEMATTLVSGLSHLRFGNVNRELFWRLMVPGILGGVIGAYALSTLELRNKSEMIRPFIAGYLVIMGMMILRKAFAPPQEKPTRKVRVLGFFGGLLDAMGGGGWGPIVSSNLIASGRDPRTSIGSVNLAEFFVKTAEVATFTTMLRIEHWKVIVGLLLGGVIAAPLAAIICGKLEPKLLMKIVGVLIILLSLRNLVTALI